MRKPLLLLLLLPLCGWSRSTGNVQARQAEDLGWTNFAGVWVPRCATSCLIASGFSDSSSLCAGTSVEAAQQAVSGCMDDRSSCPENFANDDFKNSLTSSLCVSSSTTSSTAASSTSSRSSSSRSSSSSTTSSASSSRATSSARSSSASSATPSATSSSIALPTQPPHTEEQTTADAASGGKSKLSTGAIIGIAFGVAAFVMLLGALLFWRWRRRQHRTQSRAMSLEPTSPRDRSGAGVTEWRPPAHRSGWQMVGSVSSTPTLGGAAGGAWARASTPQLAPLNTAAANEREKTTGYTDAPAGVPPMSGERAGDYGISIAVSPVSPMTAPSSRSRTSSLAQHLQPAPAGVPAVAFTPATPTNNAYAEQPVSPISPVSESGFGTDRDRGRDREDRDRDSTGSSIISLDDVMCYPIQSGRQSQAVHEDYAAGPEGRRHSCSPPTMVPRIPSPKISSGQHRPGSMARADSISWRREVEEAAARASNRVIQAEQAGETAAPKKKPGPLDKLTKRWSKDRDAVDAAPKSPGFLSRKRTSDGSGRESGIVIV